MSEYQVGSYIAIALASVLICLLFLEKDSMKMNIQVHIILAFCDAMRCSWNIAPRTSLGFVVQIQISTLFHAFKIILKSEFENCQADAA